MKAVPLKNFPQGPSFSQLSRKWLVCWKGSPSEWSQCGTWQTGSCSITLSMVLQDSGHGWWKLLASQQKGWCVPHNWWVFLQLSIPHVLPSSLLLPLLLQTEVRSLPSVKWKRCCASFINQKQSVKEELQRPSAQLDTPQCSNSRDLQRLCLQCCMCSTYQKQTKNTLA